MILVLAKSQQWLYKTCIQSCSVPGEALITITSHVTAAHRDGRRECLMTATSHWQTDKQQSTRIHQPSPATISSLRTACKHHLYRYQSPACGYCQLRVISTYIRCALRCVAWRALAPAGSRSHSLVDGSSYHGNGHRWCLYLLLSLAKQRSTACV